jgi:Mrp family chromosome partitioning ATPase
MSAALVRSFDGIASRIDAAGARNVGFTSTLSGEGTSTIAIGTALALAEMRQDKVLLVDANWLRPTLTADAHQESAPGLADYMARRVELADAIRSAEGRGLDFLPVGDRGAARPTLRGLAALLTNDVACYQTVLIDLPPVLAGEAYVLPWATLLDHLFVVLREAATPLPLVRQALGKIGLATPQIVLNRTTAASAEIAPSLVAARRRTA